MNATDYMVLRCEACGMLHVVHRSEADGNNRCHDCGRGPLSPMGYAIAMGKRIETMQIGISVDTSELEKVEKMVEDIDNTVANMINRLDKAKEELNSEANK